MVKLAVENGKFIIKNGKVAVVEDGKSACGCCCNECCWKIASMTGCPAPEVDVNIENNEISFTFLDSESCREIGTPQPCRPNPNADDTTDKTTCNQLQYMVLTNEWTIKETTNVTIDLSGTSETSAPDKDYIDITLTPLSGQKIIGDGGDPRFRPAGTYHARIASDDGELGTSEDGCDMNDISGSWNFELEPGCWSVRVYSCTRDAFSHIGMKNSVSFSFDPEKPQNCKDHLCTSVECGSIIGAGTGGTGAAGIRNEINPRTGASGYGFALIDGPLTECSINDFDEESEEKPQSVKDCIKVCEQKPDNPCKRISYYCCVDGVCNRFTKKLCGTDTKSSDEKSGVDGEADVGGGLGDNFCSENGPYYCTLKQCTDSEECKVKYCCDADGEVCRPCNKVAQSSDEKNGVDGNGFDTLEECRETCEANAKYNCDTGINGENAECVKAKDPDNASYDNIDACIEDCEEDKGNRYTCTEAGECVRNAFGEYENADACINDCGGDGEGQKWYCCYEGPPPKKGAPDNRKTSCKRAPDVPQFDQNGKQIPVCEDGAESGPHSARLCSIVCGGYNCVRRCDGSRKCQKPQNGEAEYSTLKKCLSSCKTMKGPKPPCSISEAGGGEIDNDDDDPKPGLDREWKWYDIDEFQRSICISYSTNGKPIKIQIFRPTYDANCNITGARIAQSSPWFGEKDCDCEARKNAGGSFDNTLKGKVRWTKPRGLILFAVRVLSCDIGSYEFEVGCDECKQVDDQETVGACCYYDLDNGDFLGCDENDIPKKICEDPKENSDGEGGIKRVIGKFLGPCSKCQDKDGNDNCSAKKGACCIDDNEAVKSCRDRMAKKKCEEEFGGDYQGDDTWCDEPENRNNPKIDKDKIILCPGLGACCILNWQEIPVSDCSVVDYIEIGGQKGSTSDTKGCSDPGECTGIEVGVKNKSIKCIEASQENKDLLGHKIPAVKVLTSVILPEKNCDGSTIQAKGNTIEMIPLEDYPESYEPPFTIKTKAQQFGNGIKKQKVEAKNGGEVGDIVIIKTEDGKVSKVWKAIGYNCSHEKEKDCDDQEGIFTKDQNCCKTFAENKIDCEEPWCDQNMQAARFSSYSYEDSPIDYGNTRVIKKSDSSGPGTELKKLLSKIGINASENCSCNSRARIMDRWGPEGCEEEIGTIVGWLKEEAKKRGLPFVEMAGYILVKRAIHNARKNHKD